MFQLKDQVVYPGQGVAVIEEVMEKTVAGKTLNFFKLKFLFKDMTILIPVEGNSDSMGVRHLSTLEEIELSAKELLKAPKKAVDASDFTPSSWNRRNKDYQLKIQGGQLIEITGIYRDLMHIAKFKELSFGEKNLLHTIEELMVQEIGAVKKQDRNDVIRDLRAPFQQISFGVQGSSTATAI